MIYSEFLWVWTINGWKRPHDLYIGDTIMSFNPDRNCCEYDKVYSVETAFNEQMGLGIWNKGMRQLLTPDHHILVWHYKNKQLERFPIEDRFMRKIHFPHKGIIYNSMYEPYIRTQDIEDIKWSARVTATYCMSKKYVDVWDIVRNLGGYESQIWIDTFFHWNSLLYSGSWQYRVRLPNHSIRDIIFHIAPRAGLGAYWKQPDKIIRDYSICISNSDPVHVNSKLGWVMKPMDYMFNMSSKNGNFLARNTRANFIVACDYKENK